MLGQRRRRLPNIKTCKTTLVQRLVFAGLCVLVDVLNNLLDVLLKR